MTNKAITKNCEEDALAMANNHKNKNSLLIHRWRTGSTASFACFFRLYLSLVSMNRRIISTFFSFLFLSFLFRIVFVPRRLLNGMPIENANAQTSFVFLQLFFPLLYCAVLHSIWVHAHNTKFAILFRVEQQKRQTHIIELFAFFIFALEK